MKIFLLAIICLFTPRIYSNTNDTLLHLSKIKINDSTKSINAILDSIVAYEQKYSGKKDTVLFSLLVSPFSISHNDTLRELYRISITGVDKEWPFPNNALNSILGYIQLENICFLVSTGGNNIDTTLLNVFKITKTRYSIKLLKFTPTPSLGEDDTVFKFGVMFITKTDSFMP